MQWLDLPAWKVGDRGFELRSDIQVSKKENVSSPLTREHSILWEPSCARGSVFGQCHLINLNILRILYRPFLAYMCTKVA